MSSATKTLSGESSKVSANRARMVASAGVSRVSPVMPAMMPKGRPVFITTWAMSRTIWRARSSAAAEKRWPVRGATEPWAMHWPFVFASRQRVAVPPASMPSPSPMPPCLFFQPVTRLARYAILVRKTSRSLGRLGEVCQGFAQIAAVSLERATRFRRTGAQGDENGHFQVAVRLPHRLDGCGIVAIGDLRDHDLAAPAQLGIRRAHVDHQAAIDPVEAHHDQGREQVEDDLLRRARLHACRAGNDLLAGISEYRMGAGFENGRVGIVGDADGLRPAGGRLLQGRDGEGRAAAGRDADHHVVGPDVVATDPG